MTHFDTFGVEYVTEGIKRFIENKSIIGISFRIKAHDSIMCEYFCIGFWFYDSG